MGGFYPGNPGAQEKRGKDLFFFRLKVIRLKVIRLKAED